MTKLKEQIFDFFPCDLEIPSEIENQIQEIRIRLGQAITFRCSNHEFISSLFVNENLIIKLLENFTSNSIYAVQSEINSGFITIKGGHRIGISGTCIFENGKIKNIRYISSLNIRVAHEIKGCGTSLINSLFPNYFENTLILSSPGFGKTTLLRDMIRELSMKGNNVSVIDERSEIAAMYKGVAQNDLGPRTDVMNNCRKDTGIRMMIRSMAPNIIATDEIGDNKDIDAIYEANFAGIKLLLTAHGDELNDVPGKLLKNKLFKNIIILKNESRPGLIKKIYKLQEDKYVVNS
ncbi:MAG: stage III sporulation protein AA [Clostridia bacterium]|nr:stage III sporulation protein AA [Clostridia bacterium]